MPMKLSQMLTDKFAEVVILGRSLAPTRALEVIRSTDTYFRGRHDFPVWMRGSNQDYCRALDEAFCYPGAARLSRITALDDAGKAKLCDVWRRRWGAIDLRWIMNHQVLDGSGFCHSDGSVAFVGELEDYPTGPEVLQDLRRIARAFPDLSMDVAIWCTAGNSMLGLPFTDALETPWPPELIARVAVPTVGFLVRDGDVITVRGFDQRLYAGFGIRYPQAVERALQEVRRLAACRVIESGFAPRNHPGLPDEVLRGWIAKARALGLAR